MFINRRTRSNRFACVCRSTVYLRLLEGRLVVPGLPWKRLPAKGSAGRRQGAPQCRALFAARPGERVRGAGRGFPGDLVLRFGAARPLGARLEGGRRVEQLLRDSSRSTCTLLLAGFFQYFFHSGCAFIIINARYCALQHKWRFFWGSELLDLHLGFGQHQFLSGLTLHRIFQA